MVGAQEFADPLAGRRPDLRAEPHERVERGGRKNRRLDHIDPAILRELPEIEDMVADRYTHARRKAVLCREHAIGQVLDRKVRGRINSNKRAELWVVWMGHSSTPIPNRHGGLDPG